MKRTRDLSWVADGSPIFGLSTPENNAKERNAIYNWKLTNYN